MAQHKAAWFEAQYNNRARVPDSVAILARWAEASALARARLRCELDIAYGHEPGETLDVFPANAPTADAADSATASANIAAGAPVLVFIHGGWWRALDKADHSFVAPAFVQAGAMVVVPNYALCPAVGIEDIALQTTRALAWVWRNAARFGGDPSRIFVVGHSAGGHLAAMLLTCRWPTVAPDLPARLLAGAMAVSGVFDLLPIRQTPFLQADLQLTSAAVRCLSPAYFARPRGPLVALVGADESDEHQRQNQLSAPSGVPPPYRCARPCRA